jgi:hypothetical protein
VKTVARLCGIAALVLASLPAGAAGARREIPLTRDGGVYRVQATIDGWLVRSFIVDSGAADVQVPAEVYFALLSRGEPVPRFLPGGSYRLADGRVVQSSRFLIRRLRIGDHEFPDVAASIAEQGAPLLLGQNVLARLGAWSIDNRRAMLVLGDAAARPPPGCLSWQTAPPTCAVAAVRDHFRDARPRYDVTSLVLLRSDGARATVLADVLRRDGSRTPVRLCGQIELRHAATGWRVTGADALREISDDGRCLP